MLNVCDLKLISLLLSRVLCLKLRFSEKATKFGKFSYLSKPRGRFFSNFVAVSEILNFKAAKIEEISDMVFDIYIPSNIKTKWAIFSNFVVVSENLNLKAAKIEKKSPTWFCHFCSQ
jgi:dimeric dUTPase (all-alpha-NTP-PPase superfamily)